MVVALRRHTRKIRLRGLLIVSLIAAVTHPLLDWTNNYGIRPLLPWSSAWVYGDLVFIVDPYIWLLLGSVVFLLTSNTKFKTVAWTVLGAGLTTFIGLAGWRSGPDGAPLRIAFVAWFVALLILGTLRMTASHKTFTSRAAAVALLVLVGYWGMLAIFHRSAVRKTTSAANAVTANNGERFIRAVAMPMAATPFEWQSVAETDRAMYRFKIGVSGATVPQVQRYPKPVGPEAQLISNAAQDRRAQTLLGFARFPIARVDTANCLGQALVQFADLRYTEPGSPRGNFSVNIPVDCPAR